MLSFFVYGGLHSACTAFVFSRTLSSMAGIYLHIPFCKQACHYCDFHFTTSQRGKPELLDAMLREIDLRKEEMSGQVIDTIYFGGGTPSLLTHSELMRFFDAIYSRFEVNPTAEITLEANPDDLSKTQLKMFRDTPVNRFSIGIQSFREQDLKSMNRAHTSAQAERCTLDAADAGFENLSVDLIFGLPDLSMEAWMENVKMALALPITHVSCYGLTIEPKTALAWQINKGMVKIPDDELAAEQYQWLLDMAEDSGFPWYEISNFAQPGFESKHNTSYWKGIPYFGIGPSAHSFDGKTRSWNVSSNAVYVKEMQEGRRAAETESLDESGRFHELVLTSLRVRNGLSVTDIRSIYGNEVYRSLLEAAQGYIEQDWLIHRDDRLKLSRQGLLFADKITSDLFVI
jgi:oxygen-independent coproporphyrinogen-3 oxidase